LEAQFIERINDVCRKRNKNRYYTSYVTTHVKEIVNLSLNDKLGGRKRKCLHKKNIIVNILHAYRVAELFELEEFPGVLLKKPKLNV
jgi:hypothetical protein